MSECGCDSVCNTAPPDPGYRRALWIALVLNALMFGVELAASFSAQSVSLLADAVDFLGDAANYGVALFVLGLAPVRRSRTALWKGWLMVGYGVFVLGKSAWQWSAGIVPEPFIMGWVSMLALAVNVGVAAVQVHGGLRGADLEQLPGKERVDVAADQQQQAAAAVEVPPV